MTKTLKLVTTPAPQLDSDGVDRDAYRQAVAANLVQGVLRRFRRELARHGMKIARIELTGTPRNPLGDPFESREDRVAAEHR
jgi:hypothetical protein